jgi:hypothetical protein
MTLPLAHIGHYLWVFYILPVLIVIVGILRSVLLERRRAHTDLAGSSRSGGSEADGGSVREDDPPGG